MVVASPVSQRHNDQYWPLMAMMAMLVMMYMVTATAMMAGGGDSDHEGSGEFDDHLSRDANHVRAPAGLLTKKRLAHPQTRMTIMTMMVMSVVVDMDMMARLSLVSVFSHATP